MPELGGTFDTSTAEKRQGFEVIRGTFPAQIIESDVVATKTGGTGAKFTFEIIDGPHKGRKVWGFINIQSNSAEAQRIGQSELRELCESVGLSRVDNTDLLHFKPLMLKCGADKQDPDRTVPKGYKPYGQATGGQQAVREEQQQTQAGGFQPSGVGGAQPQRAAAGGGSRPWR